MPPLQSSRSAGCRVSTPLLLSFHSCGEHARWEIVKSESGILADWLTFLVTVYGKNYWLCILTRIPVKGLSGRPGEQLEEGWWAELRGRGCGSLGVFPGSYPGLELCPAI